MRKGSHDQIVSRPAVVAVAVVAVALVAAAGSWKATAAKKDAALWTVDLQKRYGLDTFDREISAKWTGQQGVVFLSPDKVLVYQVNRLREAHKLAPRSQSGGAGNFALEIRVITRVMATISGSSISPPMRPNRVSSR